MDLSKAFDTLDHSLLLAKLSAHGLDNNLLSFVQSYLTNTFQRCRIEKDFSSQITTDVPQGSVFGPFLSNVFFNDIFLFVESLNVFNYADDNTLFAFGKKFDEVIRKLQNDVLILGKCFLTTSLYCILTNIILCLLDHLSSYPILNVKMSEQHVLIITAFIKSFFNYCPLVRMFCYTV